MQTQALNTVYLHINLKQGQLRNSHSLNTQKPLKAFGGRRYIAYKINMTTFATPLF